MLNNNKKGNRSAVTPNEYVSVSNEAKRSFTTTAHSLLDYAFNQINKVRILVNSKHNSILFCAYDIANIFGYSQVNNMYCMLKDCEKHVYSNTSYNNQDIVFITFSAVIKLINIVRSPKAMDFQNWLLCKLLPSLYKQ